MKRIKALHHELLFFVREHKLLFFCTVLILIFLSVAFPIPNVRTVENEQRAVSIADYFLLLKQPLFFYLANIFVAVFLLFRFMKNHFKINFLVRQENIGLLYTKHCCAAGYLAFCVSLIQAIVTLGVGAFHTPVLINFNQINSAFYFYADAQISSISFFGVFAVTFLFGFICIFMFLLLYIALRWLTGRDFICFIIILLVGLLDSYGNFGVVSYFGASYADFVPSYHFLSLIGIAAVCAMIFYAGKACLKYKEFLHEK